MLSLSEYRSRRKGFPDYLNFAALIDDGVVLCKDGTLLRGFYYEGVDVKELSSAERDALSVTCNNALQRLGSGWSLWFDCIKRPVEDYLPRAGCHFPDPVSERIDEERRTFFAEGEQLVSFTLEHFIFLSYRPPREGKQKVVDSFLFGEQAVGQEQGQAKVVNYFLKASNDVADTLASAVVVSPMLDIEEDGVHYSPVLSYLQYCITQELYPFVIPPCPMYLDAVLGRVDVFASHELAVNGKELGIVALDGFPQQSFPQMMRLIEGLPVEFRWSSRFIAMDAHEARSEILKFRRKWQQKVRSITAQVFKTQRGIVDHDAQLMVYETEGALSDISSNLVSYGYYSSICVVHGDTRQEVAEKQKYVVKALKQLGFFPRIETINATESWIGSIPGHVVQNVRRPLLSTRNLADMLPLTQPYQGERTNPSSLFAKNAPALFQAVAPGNVPFSCNLHVSDVGHSFVFGPSGAGKSVLLGFIAAQFLRYEGAQVFVFDKGRSMYPLTKAVGGSHIELSENNKLTLCPLGDLDSPEALSHAREWVDRLMNLQGVNITPERNKLIMNALEQLRESSDRSLSSFQICLQNKVLKDALHPYLTGGATGGLFDAEEDSWKLHRFITFEMEHVMQMGDRYVLPFLLYLFRKIERSLTGAPSIIILDEAWLFLSHPLFAAQIREWLKVLRKANCALVMASQSLSDVEGSDIGDVIAQECRTKFYLANASANTEIQRHKYLRLGATEQDLHIIESLASKREYYVVSPKGRSIFDLMLGDYARAFLTHSSKEDLRRIAELSMAPHWQELWFQECSQGIRRAA